MDLFEGELQQIVLGLAIYSFFDDSQITYQEIARKPLPLSLPLCVQECTPEMPGVEL